MSNRLVCLMLAWTSTYITMGCSNHGDLLDSRDITPSAHMWASDPWRLRKEAFETYNTSWRSNGAEFAVSMFYPGQELFGTPYRIHVYDSEQNLVRVGDVTAQQDDFPYCLVEVFVSDDGVSEEYRNKWTLAVAFWRHRQKYDPMSEFHIECFSSPEGFTNMVNLEPVEWNDKPMIHGSGRLSRAVDIKVRPCEAGVRMKIVPHDRLPCVWTLRILGEVRGNQHEDGE